IGQGGTVLVMAESGGAPPAPVAPQSVKLPAAPIQRIVVSPDKTLLALVENELYKSEDHGESWALISGGLPSPRSPQLWGAGGLVSVAFSPHYASDQTLLAGFSMWNIGSGIYKSTDGGRIWRLASRGLSDLQVQEVAFAADGTAFARTTRHGLFKSTDGGDHWTALEEPQTDRPTSRHARTLAISPDYAADGTLFLSLDEMDRYVVLKSTNGGQSWEEVLNRTARLLAISPPLPPPQSWGGKRGGDRTVYAVLSGAGLMRSTDGGKTWQAANSGLVYEDTALSDLVLSPSFAEDKTLYALFGGKGIPRLYRSTDGGDNWRVLKEDIPISAFALLPDGGLLLGTVYGSIDGLRAERLVWEDLTVGLDGLHIYDLAISPGYAQDQTVYAATSKAGVFVSHDGGRSWHETGFPGRAGLGPLHLAISPEYVADQTLFTASRAGVHRWLNGDWQELQQGLGNLFPASALAISPSFSADHTLFVAGDYRHPQVFISRDGGESWTSASRGLPEDRFEVASLVISPNYAEDGTAYAWLQYQGLYRTVNGSLSWEQVTEEEDWYVQSMALSPDFAADVHRLADGSLFVGAMYGNLHRSDDGGFTWRSLGGGLPSGTIWVKALAVSPEFARDGTLFAGLDRGIHKSTDGGYSWQAVNTGL
ncbi:MAG: PQQ-binding-like beta-propeller repeat protein, partial [Ardenticatenia bacterium]|nr:PQQ-binding-like beta-propeller repeat protein [Ardenticatenia bacterium]